jgi:hypothetical protein
MRSDQLHDGIGDRGIEEAQGTVYFLPLAQSCELPMPFCGKK